MGKFNPAEYETVDSRLKRFLQDYPKARVITEAIELNGSVASFKAELYFDIDDSVPSSTGHAYEERVMEKSKSTSGLEYEAVNYTSWVENCETSAIGRALANCGYSGAKRPSQEEMQKVQNMSTATKMGIKDVLSDNMPKCTDCGAPTRISKSTGKPYCSAKCWLEKDKKQVSDDPFEGMGV